MAKYKKIGNIDPHGDDGLERPGRLNSHNLRILAAAAMGGLGEPDEIVPQTPSITSTTHHPGHHAEDLPTKALVPPSSPQAQKPPLDLSPKRNPQYEPSKVDDIVRNIVATTGDESQVTKRDKLYAELIPQCDKYYRSILERNPIIRALLRKSVGSVDFDDLVQNHLLNIDKNMADYMKYMAENDKKLLGYLSFSANFLIHKSVEYMEKNGVSSFALPGITPAKKIYAHEQRQKAAKLEAEREAIDSGSKYVRVEPLQPTAFDNHVVAAKRILRAGQVKPLDTVTSQIYTTPGIKRPDRPRGIAYADTLPRESSLTQNTPLASDGSVFFGGKEYDIAPGAAEEWFASAGLNEKQQVVMRLRFGLVQGGEGALTLEETSKELGLTRERIRQIEAVALQKLRHHIDKIRVIDYSLQEYNDEIAEAKSAAAKAEAKKLAERMEAASAERLESEADAIKTVVRIAYRSTREDLSPNEQLDLPSKLARLVSILYHRAEPGSLADSFDKYIRGKYLRLQTYSNRGHFFDIEIKERYKTEIQKLTGDLTTLMDIIGAYNEDKLKEFIAELGHATTSVHYKHHLDDIVGWLTDMDSGLPKRK